MPNSIEGRRYTGRASGGVTRRAFLAAPCFSALGIAASADVVAGAMETGKRGVTYYTDSQRRAARWNVDQYDWATAIREETVAAAETALSQYTLDDLWRYVGSQHVPRSAWLAGNTVNSPPGGKWTVAQPIDGFGYAAEPGAQWTVTNGEYTLPTNDFEAYRRSGLDERGAFDPELADDSLLVNERHPEMGATWGVDDGLGWVDTDGDLGPAGQQWVPVAWAHHWPVVYGYRELLGTLFHAYLYTDEQKYARAASVILDRVGDVYPDFSLQNTVHFDTGGYTERNGFPNPSHGGTGRGKQLGSIWESFWVKQVLRAYDAVYPAQEGDEELVSFLQDKSTEYPALSSKASVQEIRSNIEQNLLQEILPAVKNAQIRGNLGSHQTTLALAAVIQDEPQYTSEAIEFVLQAGGLQQVSDATPWGEWRVTGGDIRNSLLETVDRDGFPHEGSIHYNSLVKTAIHNVVSVIDDYDAADTDTNIDVDTELDGLYDQLFAEEESLVFLNGYVPSLGDTKRSGNPGLNEMVSVDTLIESYSGDDPEFTQWLYLRNEETTDGLRESIFEWEPTAITNEIKRILASEGPLDMASRQLAGFGFTGLRAGTAGTNGRGVWTYYGRNGYGPEEGYGTSHCHRDTLNIGLFAHGVDLTPDLGYPEQTGDWPKRWNWTANTISHNTVLVDEQPQNKQWVATPKRFDHTDRVQLFDIDATHVYNAVEQYRRTTAQIAVDAENSYVVDFFRIDGGDDHHFSFHGAQTVDEHAERSSPRAFALRAGEGRVTAPNEDHGVSGADFDIVSPSSGSSDWRGVAFPAGGSFSATVRIGAVLSTARWPLNQSVYLGRDMNGQHVCAGVGGALDERPRIGLFYPDRGEWGDTETVPEHTQLATDEIQWTEQIPDAAASKMALRGLSGTPPNRRYTLSVTCRGVAVDIDLLADGSTLASGSFSLDSTTDDRAGVFGAIGADQIGRLRFENFRLDGVPSEAVVSDGTRSSNTEPGITTRGLSLTAQQTGTYAGPDVPKPGHGETTRHNETVGNGFNYLYNVRRDGDPSEQFSVEWTVGDYWNAVGSTDGNPTLRLTMVEPVDDVALANGDPPHRWGNPETFTYLLAHRSGENLHSVFTSVIEPYRDRFVESIEAVSVESNDPTARAVRIELLNGRTDYVASASAHETVHTVGEVFSFTGAFAVYAERDGAPAFAYLNDGVRLTADARSQPLLNPPSGRINGVVTDFTRKPSPNNTIEITATDGFWGCWSLSDLSGAWIYADATDNRNGAYEIIDARTTGGGQMELDVGAKTTIKGSGTENEYEYVLERNGSFVIPMSVSWSA